MNKKGNSLILIIVGVLLIAVIGGAAAYYFFVYNKTSTEVYGPPVQTNNTSPQTGNEKPKAQPIQNSTEVDKLTNELNKTQTDDTTENLSVSDTTGL